MTYSGDRAPSSGRGYAYGGPAIVLLGDFFAWLLIGIGAGFILLAFVAAIGK